MPPKPTMTVPNGKVEPVDLVPNPDQDMVEEGEETFAGFPVVPAKQLQRDAFSAIFYAFPGVGKTTVAGMFAAYKPAREVLIVDAEGGASVLAHLDHVQVLQVSKWMDVEKVLARLETMPLDKIPYRTVVWDNLTEFQDMHFRQIVGNGKIEIQDYGVNLAKLMNFIRRVRDLSRKRGINTVILSWQETRENKLTKRTREVVALTDKASTRIPGIVNVVGHITIENNPPLYTRKMSFAANPNSEAKFRRSIGDNASPIPDVIYYGLDQNPIYDMLRTLYEGVPFPSDKYAKPKGRKKVPGDDASDTETDAEE